MTYFYECVEFGADPDKYQDLVNLNVVSKGDCWALVETRLDICEVKV